MPRFKFQTLKWFEKRVRIFLYMLYSARLFVSITYDTWIEMFIVVQQG